MLIRIIDVAVSLLGLFILSPVLMIIFFIGIFDTGAPFFLQVRVGLKQKPFILFKFRTMKMDTASMGSHLVDPAMITYFGKFLRRAKLDELPQLWNVLKGDMSLVGPRPCLLNQTDVIKERSILGVFDFKPGITGLAQINKIDMSQPKRLAEADAEMLKDLTIRYILRIIINTLIGKGFGDAVKRK